MPITFICQTFYYSKSKQVVIFLVRNSYHQIFLYIYIIPLSMVKVTTKILFLHINLNLSFESVKLCITDIDSGRFRACNSVWTLVCCRHLNVCICWPIHAFLFGYFCHLLVIDIYPTLQFLISVNTYESLYITKDLFNIMKLTEDQFQIIQYHGQILVFSVNLQANTRTESL